MRLQTKGTAPSWTKYQLPSGQKVRSFTNFTPSGSCIGNDSRVIALRGNTGTADQTRLSASLYRIMRYIIAIAAIKITIAPEIKTIPFFLGGLSVWLIDRPCNLNL